MSTIQRVGWLGSLLIVALQASPCVAQTIFYVRDAAGYVRPVVIHQPAVFSMGMQAQGIVVRGGTFVRLNVMPFGVSMPDPATNIRVMVPGPNLGVFSSGMRQPALISQQPIVLSVQGGTFGPGTFGGSSMFSSSQFSSGPFMLWR